MDLVALQLPIFYLSCNTYSSQYLLYPYQGKFHLRAVQIGLIEMVNGTPQRRLLLQVYNLLWGKLYFQFHQGVRAEASFFSISQE